jgi:hypothetical protein
MSEHRLLDRYTDLSSVTGFQFEFYCERCADAWRSPFVRYTEGRFPAVMDTAARLMAPRNAPSRGLAAFRGAAWDRARAAAFFRAARSAVEHFHLCASCRDHCCPGCWDRPAGVCTACASPERALDATLSASGGDAVTRARLTHGPAGSVSRRPCSVCGFAAGNSSFCPRCGAGLGEKQACRSCGTAIPGAARFCPACGLRRRK